MFGPTADSDYQLMALSITKRPNPRRARRLLLYLAIASLAVLAGILYQSRKTASDLAAFPPPGRMITLDGVDYHLLCMGTGSPTLILEAGLGETSLSWHTVQSRLAEDMRVCSYDRAGLGWSGPATAPMQPPEVARNLHRLLNDAGIPGPYVLVGHSRGGIFVRAFNHQYPDETLGLVLVDSTHEQGPMHHHPYAQWDYAKQAFLISIAEPLSRIGIVRLLGLADANRQSSPLPTNILAAKTAVQNRTDTARAIVNEISVMRAGLDPATPPPQGLGGTPLLVLTAGNRIDPRLAEREAKRLNKEVGAELALARIHRIDQEELTRLSTNSRQIIVEGSGHFVMYDRPDELINAVREFAKPLVSNLETEGQARRSPGAAPSSLRPQPPTHTH